MSGPIGHTFLYNMIILFILIVVAFLVGTMSYYKAFKINNRIVNSIEKFEGYNAKAKDEIEKTLGTFGYRVKQKTCQQTYDYRNQEYKLVSLNEKYNYCIYVSNDRPAVGTYYDYGVLTYMNVDLPIISEINIPVFTRTNAIYKFSADSIQPVA